MNKCSDIYSISSSKLDEEKLRLKRHNERIGTVIGVISQFIWAINSIQLKTYKSFFPNDFSNNSLVFWRSLPIWVLGYFFCWKKGVRIKPLSAIKHKFWFVSRSFGNYVSIFLWIKILSYFRVSTSQVIAGCYPVLVIFLSILILHEKFYFRYIISVFVCIFGSALIVLNEKNPNVSKIKLNDNKLAGLFFATCHLLVSGFSNLGQKIQVKDNMTADEQNYYLGMYNTLPALFFCIIEMHFGFSSILYILYAISNGFFIFYSGNYLQTVALQYMAVSKFMTITYMCTVFVFIFGFVLLGEVVYITDIIGAGLIISFQLYNAYYPPGRQVNENNIDEKDKESSIQKQEDNSNNDINNNKNEKLINETPNNA
jgi:drug/metabolite transporter (DMT)-like permease